MKRDFDLVREILLAAEAQDANGNPPIAPEGYSNEDIRYHVRLMYEAGLVRMKLRPALIEPEASLFNGLTWEGHEFLDSVREVGNWEKIKGMISKKELELSFAAIKVAAVHLIGKAL